MFKLNLKIALRNLWKYKGYTIINVLGLSVGLAGCLMIFIFINYQLGFDKGYVNSDRIYRAVPSFQYPDGEFYTNGVPRPFVPALRQDFSQFEKVAGVRASAGIIKSVGDGTKAEVKKSERVYYAEPALFEIFKIKWLAGVPATALKEPYTITLSRKTAETYFGNWKHAVGKSLMFNNKETFRVTGVFEDFPENTSFPFTLVMSYESEKDRRNDGWGSVSSSQECYMLLKRGVDIKSLDGIMASFVKKYYTSKAPGKENHLFQSLKDVHYDERFSNFGGNVTPRSELVGLFVIGLFLLITACINFINLATAQAVNRSKEVGVRKVMGSMRKQLIWQFLSETTLITVVALLFACVITELSLPGMESLFGEGITFSLFGHAEVYIFMILLIIIVSFLAGFYPAMVMSGLSPALAIKNKISSTTAGGVGLRKILVVVQFAITAILIIGTLVVMNQMSFLRSKSLGFDSTSIAVLQMPSDSLSQMKFNTLKEILLKNNSIKSVSYCFTPPSSSNNHETSFSYNSSKDADFQVSIKVADEDFFKTFSLGLVAGRQLSTSDTVKEFVVNETLLKKLNVLHPEDALGKILSLNGHSLPIVGVVRDFNNVSLHERISPIAIYSQKERYSQLAIKIESNQMLPTMKMVEREWNKMFPDYVYSSNFMDEQINSYYQSERVMGTLFKVFAGVVIFISFIGLFGLISFVATQRTKEIAIRKVLGASTLELVKMLNSSFLWMVLIANLIAWPITYIFVSKWLEGFAYRAPLNIWPFVLATFLSVIITLITVSLRSYLAASGNTINALKYE
ncbi:ABC transporter permease [Pedobacter sp. JCM 36344]|uniref:ABC transporter permease n=1 Tax=Pedobacter sp. JCM 36344 TaxID=3374280 RepID=UPI003979F7EB